MNLTEKKLIYVNEEQVFQFKETLSNGITIKSTIVFDTDKFLDYQKDLIQDFIANFIDEANQEIYQIENIKESFEIGLQDLNTKLKLFADKVRDVNFFSLKGYIQVIADNLLITSMIGNVTILIFRDGKVYYSLHNGVDNKGKIDLFADFVEGDIQDQDQLIYIGTKVLDIIDHSDIKEVESILKESDSDILSFLEEIITSRTDKNNLGFISGYILDGYSGNIKTKTNKKKLINFKENKLLSNFKNKFTINKYYITIGILTIVILFMLYSLLSQILNKKDGGQFVNDSGILVDITIEDIKKDIYLFQSIEASSDEKGIKYNEILKKLDILESKGRRLGDVKELRKILNTEYNKGFNVIYISNLDQLDQATKKTNIFNFNSSEKEKLGELKNIFFGNDIFIVGNTAGLMGTRNNDMRGNLVQYGIDESINSCSLTILNDGVYCSTPSNRVYLISKSFSSPQVVTTSSEGGFPNYIAGLGTYGKTYLYVFQPNLNTLGNGVLVTRYRNIPGKQTEFTQGQNYSIEQGLLTGMSFGSGFTSFSIDGSFLVWDGGQKKLLQFRRPNPAGTTFQAREVNLVGGDKFTSTYSSSTKVIAIPNSKYVYLFDKENQNFTVYESKPLKTNETFANSYSLYYVLRYTFDLEGDKIVDITIPTATGDRPEMYILSEKQINKIDLYEFISSVLTSS